MAHKVYAPLTVTVNESACNFQQPGFGSASVGVGDFASTAALGAAATGVEGFAADATGDGFGAAATVADSGALGVAFPCCPLPAGTVTGGTAAVATVEVFGTAASGFEAEADAIFGVGTTAGSRADSCSLTSMGRDSPSG